VVSRREPERGATAPLSNPPGNGTRHWCAGQACGRADDRRFVPPDPPHSVLAFLTEDWSECVGRWVAAGTFVPAGSRKGVLRPPFRTPRGTAPGTRVPGVLSEGERWFGWAGMGAGRWVAPGRFLPGGSRIGGAAPYQPPEECIPNQKGTKRRLRLAPVPPVGAAAHVRGVGLFPQDGVGRSGMGDLSPAGAAAAPPTQVENLCYRERQTAGGDRCPRPTVAGGKLLPNRTAGRRLKPAVPGRAKGCQEALQCPSG